MSLLTRWSRFDAGNVSLCGVEGRGWVAVAVSHGKLRAELKPCSKKVSGAFHLFHQG